MLRCIYIYPLLLSLLFLFNSCQKQNEIVSETRTLSPFTTLDVYDKIDVYYTQDTGYNIRVVAEQKLQAKISTEVSGGVLTIKDNNKFNFLRGSHAGITVYVTAPFIRTLKQNGVGTIYCTNTIKEDTICYSIQNSGDIHMNVNVISITGSMYGVGDVYLNGTAQFHNVNAAGECFVNAQGLTTNYTFIVYNSTGQANVNATVELDAVTNYSGNIYYTGNPSVIHKSGTGSGKLIPN